MAVGQPGQHPALAVSWMMEPRVTTCAVPKAAWLCEGLEAAGSDHTCRGGGPEHMGVHITAKPSGAGRLWDTGGDLPGRPGMLQAPHDLA